MSSAAARSSLGPGTTPEGCQARLARSLPERQVLQLNSQGYIRLCSIRTRKAEKGLSDLARPPGKECNHLLCCGIECVEILSSFTLDPLTIYKHLQAVHCISSNRGWISKRDALKCRGRPRLPDREPECRDGRIGEGRRTLHRAARTQDQAYPLRRYARQCV